MKDADNANTKHSQGPWKMYVGAYNNIDYIVVDSDNKSIGESVEGYEIISNMAEVVCAISTVDAINDRDIANGKLIVAAPDMLEALKWFCDLVDDVDDGEVSIRKTYARFKEIINRIERNET